MKRKNVLKREREVEGLYLQDQIGRLEEKENEQKKEYTKLHERFV